MSKKNQGTNHKDVNVVETDYADHSRGMTAAKNVEVLTELARLSVALKALADRDVSMKEEQCRLQLEGVNLARDIGRQLELFTGHQKLLPAEYNALAPSLTDAPLEFAKKCLALHQKYPVPVENFEVAVTEWRDLMVQLELLPKPARLEAQTAHVSEPIKDFFGTVGRVRGELLELEKKLPLEKWERFNLQSLIGYTQDFHDLHERAQKLVAGGQKTEDRI